MRTVFNEVPDGGYFYAGGCDYQKISGYKYEVGGRAILLKDENGNSPSMKTETCFRADHPVIYKEQK